MEELFCIAGDKEVISGEIGTIRACINNKIPYNKIDIDIGNWISKFIAGESEINFRDDENELNALISSLHEKEKNLQKEIDLIKESLKNLMEYPSFLGILDFIERMNKHVKICLGKFNTRMVDNNRNQLETAKILQYGWKCFLNDGKFTFKSNFGTESTFEYSDEDDSLFLSINEKSSLKEETFSFLDEKSGLLNVVQPETKNDSGFGDDSLFGNNSAYLDEKSGLISDISSDMNTNETNEYGYLDEKSGKMIIGNAQIDTNQSINENAESMNKYTYMDDKSGIMMEEGENMAIDDTEQISVLENLRNNFDIPALMDIVMERPVGMTPNIEKKKKRKKKNSMKKVRNEEE